MSLLPALVVASLRALPLLGGVLLLCAMFPRSDPRVRHAALTAAVVGLLLLPPLAALLPELPLPVLEASVQAAAEAAPGSSIRPAFLGADLGGYRGGVGIVAWFIWAAGAGVGAVRLVLGMLGNRRCVRAAAAAGRVLRVGPRGRTRLVFSDHVSAPATSGLFRPVVLLPARAVDWSPAERRAILRHEFSHVRRHDAWTQLVGRLARILHWFNPLVWTACREQRRASEEAADARVTRCEMPGGEFADLLIRFARESRLAPAFEPTLPLSASSTLGVRVRRLIEGGWNPPRRGRLAGSTFVLVVLTLLVTAGAPTFTAGTMDAFARHHGVPAHRAKQVLEAARAEGVAPGIAFGLVRVESDFDASRRSPGGAVGLTQILPTTARTLDPSVSTAELWRPETNLRLGFRLLRRFVIQFHGDLDRALLAYAQGPGNVDAGTAGGSAYPLRVMRASRLGLRP